MRRAVLLFVMCVLSLQSLWAAAGTVCAHERGSDVRHLGHHEHRHTAADQAAPDADAAQAGYHPDCATCHGTPAALSIGGQGTATLAGEPVRIGAQPYVPDRVPDHPLRPPTSHLA
ncbi:MULTISPECIES: hypothetical protein [unclassified Variovorax]|uniref:hypothetical protein n=1 Tax=unclassified Variovorax TaxID=663243 RepID=UPI002575726B|nr:MULTISPECIES: hypothetical protein [unclassified Variovorax]MDM0086176.1 hypothetical protein [Variovorax sp. J22G40]MDM0145567.1 hypothetical protein [Variovorax sp. J2P1-31]